MNSIKPRIYLLNNYDISNAETRVSSGAYPSQHLWGAWELRNRYDWIIPSNNWLAGSKKHRGTLRRLLPLTGDLAQEVFVLRRARKGDLIYAADQQSAAVLAVLRRFRILSVPLVVMVHNGPRSAWTRFWMKGADELLCISPYIASRVGSILGRNVSYLPWGPGLDSPIYNNLKGRKKIYDFVAAGKTNRDYSSLRQAIREGMLSGIIFDESGENVYHHGKLVSTSGRANYIRITDAMSYSKVIAIPLRDPDRLSGLTEAADAIALNIPIIVTDSKPFPFRGAGISFVAQGDSSELAKAILRASDDYKDFHDALERKVNMRNYSQALSEVFDEILSRPVDEVV